MPRTDIEPEIRGRAQALRRDPTDAERKMWWLLRSMKPLGMHFRRQAPIGRYIADFAWHSGKIVIELDGSQHADVRKGYDSRRTAWLQSQGYRVLRFWNIDVLKSPQSVGEAILAAVADRSRAAPQDPTPTPPHGGEGFMPALTEKSMP
jgi:very-short-patch-repair endonuclease